MFHTHPGMGAIILGERAQQTLNETKQPKVDFKDKKINLKTGTMTKGKVVTNV